MNTTHNELPVVKGKVISTIDSDNELDERVVALVDRILSGLAFSSALTERRRIATKLSKTHLCPCGCVSTNNCVRHWLDWLEEDYNV